MKFEWTDANGDTGRLETVSDRTYLTLYGPRGQALDHDMPVATVRALYEALGQALGEVDPRVYMKTLAYMTLKSVVSSTHKSDVPLSLDVGEGIGQLCQRLREHPQDVIDEKEGMDRVFCYLLITCATLADKQADVVIGMAFQALENAHAKAGEPVVRLDEFTRLCDAAVVLHDRMYGAGKTMKEGMD